MRLLSLYIVFIGVFQFVNFAEASILARCKGLLSWEKNKPVAVNDDAKLTDRVQILWYPISDYPMISHASLVVGDRVWDANKGFHRGGTITDHENHAMAGYQGYFSFYLKLTADERVALETYLIERDGKSMWQTCVSGACRALRANTGICIPVPFSQVPTLSALYLSLRKMLGDRRIAAIEYTGNSPLYNLVLSSAIVFESVVGLLFCGGVSYAMTLWINEAGELVSKLIPIVLSGGNEDLSTFQAVA